MNKYQNRKEIFVFANWLPDQEPHLIGTLNSTFTRGEEVFSFSYNEEWLKQSKTPSLDPDLHLYKGDQYLSEDKTNFGIFTDSSPDRWGRVLMQRREAILARQEERSINKLYESDYLLGVYDGNRMGGLRFKLNMDGDFLDNNKDLATPPWTRIRELEYASLQIEDDNIDSNEYIKWLNMLISPGSSLGGARPKASIVDSENNLWIAKFPSKYDDNDTGAWELIANKIATEAGINMAECKAQKYNSQNHTFLTKRFDRKNQQRIHFASAMTCLGLTDGEDGSSGVSYLDIVEFIIRNGANVDRDLEELWRRIVLNICISNVDDHLRNHGFILKENGWELSPAYDINPVADGEGLKLNISQYDNTQDIELVLSMAKYFRLEETKAKQIASQIVNATLKWREFAYELKISKRKQDDMERAFRIAESY